MSANPAEAPSAQEPVLSAQEAAIAKGARALHEGTSERVLRMFEEIRDYGPPRLTLDRSLLFLESLKETQGQPIVLRWAKALRHFAEKAPVTIFEDELIVGRPSTWLGRWAIAYAELDGSVMPAGVEMFRKNRGKPGEVAVTDEDAEAIDEILTPYWAGKDYASNFQRALPADTRFIMYGPDQKDLTTMTCVVLATSPMRHSQNWTPDYAKILRRGVRGIREEAKARLASLHGPRDLVDRVADSDAVAAGVAAVEATPRRLADGARAVAQRVGLGVQLGLRVLGGRAPKWMPDVTEKVSRGVKELRDGTQAALDAVHLPHHHDRRAFLEAVIITCDAMTLWSNRYADRAAEMAQAETDPARKQELLEIAEVCRQVPEHPARTFREALQAEWWGQLFNRIEQTSSAMGQGRMDQYLLPYYRKDLAEGRLTKESAIELLQCVWLHMYQCVEMKLNPVAAAGTEGFAKFEDVVLGGQTPDGRDATNELSYVILESTRALQITVPEPCVRIHAGTPDRFLHYIAETVKDGKGFPKLLNDEMVIPFYLANGATLKEALDWNISGCCENRLINRETNVTGNGGINFGSAVEMTFRNGKLKVLKDLQFGPRTGDPRTWTTFDQVWKAFCTHLEHLAGHAVAQQYVALKLKPRFFAAPQTSMLHDLAMEQCRDLHTHGEWFPGGIDHSCMEAIGKATAIDSLAAVKHLVFDTKKVTWDELLDAIEKNWEGKEALRQLCVNAPKYGNGVEWVDQLGFEIETFLLEFLHANPKPHGQCFLLRQIPITFHVPLGKVTWATPNGRRASEFLSEGISASHGMDVKGPTVALGSMARARNRSFREKGGDLINLKFSPANLAGEEGTRRLMQIIRTWCEQKHWHVQFNVVNRATLLAAQQEPEKYRNLIVRIAGYSAYFVDLSPAQQSEIIARTEEHLG